MKILLVADGRSVITRGWLECIAAGADVHIDLVSTFPCEKPAQVDRMLILPVAFSSLAGGQVKLEDKEPPAFSWKKRLSGLRAVLLKLRYHWGPYTLFFFRKRYVDFVNRCQPDVVHALRIPYEGMLASCTPASIPVILSTWGNDLTLHAHGSHRMTCEIQKALRRANGLMADADRDLKLAHDFGFRAALPCLMVPGNGGLDLAVFSKLRDELIQREQRAAFQIINPRGFRPGSVHQDVFFHAIPLVLKAFPDVQFVCTAMQGQPIAERFVQELGIADHVTLLPYLPQQELWSLYLRSDVYVSLSSHDGTPNTFLEAIACGCFPVVGDIASLRQWVSNRDNGLLVDPLDAEQAAQAIVAALEDGAMRRAAQTRNWKMVQKKADRNEICTRVMDFYSRLMIDL